MANVGLLLSGVSAPTGLWPIILNWIENSVVNYGWVIILFTLLVKVCLSPLDFLVRFSSKKQALLQQKLAPQLARINRKYQDNPSQARMQTNALYKKEGGGNVLSCLVMIINLAITMTVFFTLFASLRDMSAYKAINQYLTLEQAYKQEYNNNLNNVYKDFETRFKDQITKGNTTLYKFVEGEGDAEGTFVVYGEAGTASYEKYFEEMFKDKTTSDENGEAVENGLLTNFYVFGNSLSEKQSEFAGLYFGNTKDSTQVVTLLTEAGKKATEPAGKVAGEKWKEVKDSWLWVDNIWVADNYKSPIPSYNDLVSLAKNSKIKEYIECVNNIDKDLCSTITTAVHQENNRWNGFFILAVLAGVTSFLSQWISEKMNKPKNKQVSEYVAEANPAGSMGNFMKILLPALMIIFVLTSSAAFGIYIVISSIISIALSALIGVIVDACFKKKQAEIYESLEKEAMKALKKSKRREQ